MEKIKEYDNAHRNSVLKGLPTLPIKIKKNLTDPDLLPHYEVSGPTAQEIRLND